MNRRNFNMSLPTLAAASLLPGVALARHHCEDNKVTFGEFKDFVWEAVESGARDEFQRARFISPYICRSYEAHARGDWFKAFKNHFDRDIKQFDPCSSQMSHYEQKYLVCAHRAGRRAARLAETKTAITTDEFVEAMKKVNAAVKRRKKKAEIRQYLCI